MHKYAKGAVVFIVIVVLGFLATNLFKKTETSQYTQVVGAVGGGKENFLKDEEINNILKTKYNLEVESHDWSNNALVRDNLVYKDENGNEKLYDFIFFSDERFYEYYKTPAKENEAPRQKNLGGGIILNTPIVIYSWDKVCDKLISEKIVTEKNGTYYINDMTKLISYIEEGKTWEQIGLPEIYGKINITSPDPVSSSPGTTYYGLLSSIMNKGYVDESKINDILPQLKDFYKYSGFMNQTPSDIFDQYLRTGLGAKPMIVDYEKSMIDFANQNPEGYNQLKDRIRVLYPEPTIWNSHCVIALTENGLSYVKSLADSSIESIGWEKYGFRTGLIGGANNLDKIKVAGVPEQITSVTQGLKKEVYDEIIRGLKE